MKYIKKFPLKRAVAALAALLIAAVFPACTGSAPKGGKGPIPDFFTTFESVSADPSTTPAPTTTDPDVTVSETPSPFVPGPGAVPGSDAVLRAAVENCKRYEDSYLPGRETEEIVAYASSDCSILIRRVSFGSGSDRIVTYIADIYLSDITMLTGCVLRDERGRLSSGSPEDVIAAGNVLFLVNGDYLSIRKWGLYVRNGQLVRSKGTKGVDVCVIRRDGTMLIENGDTFDTDACLADPEVWHVISFGPSLLNEDGTPKNSDGEFHITDKYSRYNQYNSLVGFPVPNPRTTIGQAEDGHYIIAAIDGRQQGYSAGMTFPQLSHLMYEEGAVKAYNLDGGGSVFMYFDGVPVNQNSGGRNPSDYFCILKNDD